MQEGRVDVGGGVGLAVSVWPAQGDRRAPAFLLVHGLASNARMWDGVAPLPAEAGHDVAAVDLRGHGRSDKPDEGYDFSTNVADIVAVADALGFERPVVVGQSWGGNLVVELAASRGEAVRAVAGVDGGLIELWRDFPDWRECAEKLAPPPLTGRPLAEVEADVRRDHNDWPETGIQGMLANFEVRADGTIAPWLTRDRHMRILRAIWEHRPSELLDRIEVPVLLIPAGGLDVPVPANVKVAPLEGDHDLHAQHPDKVAALLLEHFG